MVAQSSWTPSTSVNACYDLLVIRNWPHSTSGNGNPNGPRLHLGVATRQMTKLERSDRTFEIREQNTLPPAANAPDDLDELTSGNGEEVTARKPVAPISFCPNI